MDDGTDDGTNGWMEKTSQKTTTTSFTICNEKSPFLYIGKSFVLSW
jgi:hypothetical protein